MNSAGAAALAAAVADAVAHPPNGLADVRLRSVGATADGAAVTLDVRADRVSPDGELAPVGLRERIAG